MLLPDVNVLVYAHRQDGPEYPLYRRWLEGMVGADAAFGMADLVLSGFLRVVTNPRVFAYPTPIDVALSFADGLRALPNCVAVAPGPRHWPIFRRLCREGGAKGNLVPDAFLAALAIESGSEWVTTDRGFARFPGLRWRHPLS
ncbi:MAG TPA: type II toxin-antitoxin system VapC family toxin [Thermoanaerobaculia bacterium]|nr:type II toxin-antitoxin system VapC family toxin [Thermoanaerobaculia bacterium]